MDPRTISPIAQPEQVNSSPALAVSSINLVDNGGSSLGKRKNPPSNPKAQSKDFAFTVFADPSASNDDEITASLAAKAEAINAVCEADAVSGSPQIVRVRCGLEQCPDSGKWHLQSFVKFTNKTRRGGVAVKLNLPAETHVEICKKDPKWNLVYCAKNNALVVDHGKLPFEVGVPGDKPKMDYVKLINEFKAGTPLRKVVQEYPALALRSWNNFQSIRNLFMRPLDCPSGVRGIWIYGKPGLGKSHLAKYLSQKYKIYPKNQDKWWNSYDGEAVVVLDDVDNKVFAHYLKIWADAYAFHGEVKGSSIPLRHRYFIVTSNYHPRDLFLANSSNESAEELSNRELLVEAIERRYEFFQMVVPFYRTIPGVKKQILPADDDDTPTGEYVYEWDNTDTIVYLPPRVKKDDELKKQEKFRDYEPPASGVGPGKWINTSRDPKRGPTILDWRKTGFVDHCIPSFPIARVMANIERWGERHHCPLDEKYIDSVIENIDDTEPPSTSD